MDPGVINCSNLLRNFQVLVMITTTSLQYREKKRTDYFLTLSRLRQCQTLYGFPATFVSVNQRGSSPFLLLS